MQSKRKSNIVIQNKTRQQAENRNKGSSWNKKQTKQEQEPEIEMRSRNWMNIKPKTLELQGKQWFT